VDEEVRRAVNDDVLVSEDDREPVGRGRGDERQSLPAAADRHVALVARRLTEHGVQTTRCVRHGRGRSGRPRGRRSSSGRCKTTAAGAAAGAGATAAAAAAGAADDDDVTTAQTEVVERDADRLARPDDDRPRPLGPSTAGDVADDAGQVAAGPRQTSAADIWRRLTGTRRGRCVHCDDTPPT